MGSQETGSSQGRSGYAMRGTQGRIIDALGSRIVGGEFAPGALLPREPELVEAFNVSRTSVREAMRVLAAKGLVDIRQKVGTKVRASHEWNLFDGDILRWHREQGKGAELMQDLVDLRQVLEPVAARLAAGRAEMSDLRRIDAALSLMLSSTHDMDAYARADVEFHQAVYAASHNALLRQFGTVIADVMYASFAQQQVTANSAADLLVDANEHAPVYRAIDLGDGGAAAEAMLTVVLSGKSALIRSLESGSPSE